MVHTPVWYFINTVHGRTPPFSTHTYRPMSHIHHSSTIPRMRRRFHVTFTRYHGPIISQLPVRSWRNMQVSGVLYSPTARRWSSLPTVDLPVDPLIHKIFMPIWVCVNFHTGIFQISKRSLRYVYLHNRSRSAGSVHLQFNGAPYMFFYRSGGDYYYGLTPHHVNMWTCLVYLFTML